MFDHSEVEFDHPEEVTARLRWLQQETPLAALSDAVLEAIVAQMQVTFVGANRRLVLEDQPPAALYVLRAGHLEAYHTSPDSLARASSLLPGAMLHLQELLLDQPASQTIVTLDDCELWQIPRSAFMQLVQDYPEIQLTFTRQLAAELAQVTSQLAFEQERQTALRPYLVPRVRRGIIGASRYAMRLRQDIKKAAIDRAPALIFGEPGLGKDNIAALIHFGSADRKQPLIKLNCDGLQLSGVDLFGRAGGKPGLLAWLGRGTLMLNNIQDFPPNLKPKLIRLLASGEYTPIVREGDAEPESQKSEARIIMTSEKAMPELDRLTATRSATGRTDRLAAPRSDRQQCIPHSIKVPPLRVRKADIEAQVKYYISLSCRARGLSQPQVSPEALRRLQGYDFPGNLTELENLVTRAIVQSNGALVLTEEVFWSVSSKGRRFRLNLLNTYPRLRQFLRSEWWPDRINYGLTSWVFALVVAIGWLGPQSRDQNFVLNLFWAWWWPLMLLLFPFVGRVWCAVCPFMIYGELAQKVSLKLFPRKLLPWARQPAERWGGWFLFGMFALILLWEELWNLENTAYLSSCLLLLITAGAVIFSLLFERRFWCRYLCPIGGMNGMFGKLAMIELRAQQGICAATCNTYHCYKGGPVEGEGQETGGCPVYSHPAQLEDNKDCVLCMTCLKACPHRSVELNLRPPGIELWTTHQPSYPEVALLLLLFGAVFLHRLPEIIDRVSLPLNLGNFGIHAGVSAAALLFPAIVVLSTDRTLRWIERLPRRGNSFASLKPRPFLELAYGYLPLVLGSSLAHYWRLGLTEAGRILPVTVATFGLSDRITLPLPVLVADPAVVAFLQGVTLIVAALLSSILTQKIARQPIVNLLPQHLAISGLTVLLWQLIV